MGGTSDLRLALRGALLRACHPKQRAFVCDRAGRVVACCSRRAGKSTAVLVRHALTALEYPRETSFYINRSVAAGIDVLSPAVRGLRRAGIELGIQPSVRNGRTYWVFPNGHRLWIAGCRDRGEIDNFRGQPPAACSVDEAQQFTFLQELIEEALEPGLLDLGGWLALEGTPSPIPVGPFYSASTGSNEWSSHHWTLLDNPYLPDAAAWLARRRAANGWTEHTPRYRREYLGQWVLDGDALVYPLERPRNGWRPLPVGRAHRVLGVDLGSTGTTALVVTTTVEGTPGCWVEHCESYRDAAVSDVCDVVRRLSDRWALDRIVVDAGGLGGAYVKELHSRHGLNATAARKTEKLAYIEHLRSDIKSGLVYVAESCGGVWSEATTLQWSESRQGYDERSPDHHMDALLYAWRYLRPEAEREAAPELEPGSAAWAEAESKRLRAERAREVQRMQRQRY